MERRRDKRYEVWESVVLMVLEKPEPTCIPGTVVDISRRGYRVLSTEELTVGTEVLITLNSVAIVGRVQHCESSAAEYFTAGIEITRVSSGVTARSNLAKSAVAVATRHA